MAVVQQERVFFGEKDPWGASPPTDAEKLALVDRVSASSPFSRFIGNDSALRKLQVSAYEALGTYNHMMRELAFAIFGPSSAGKTTLARLYAKAVALPFVEVAPKEIPTVDALFKKIRVRLEEEGLPLVESVRRKHYILPPMVILVDEVHAIAPSVEQGLLKATEYKDAMLATESGVTVDTRNVTWMIATTDEGKLFDAFRTRFSPVVLKLLSKADVARIVKLDNPDLSDEVCALVAHYNSRIPRKALEFARYMRMVKKMTGEEWESVARSVATDEGIDEFGMHEVHLKILRNLGMGPIAKNRISLVAGRKDEEVERYILPWLLTATDDQAAMVTVGNKGYTITEAGLAELDRRSIPHKGSKALGQ